MRINFEAVSELFERTLGGHLVSSVVFLVIVGFFLVFGLCVWPCGCVMLFSIYWEIGIRMI